MQPYQNYRTTKSGRMIFAVLFSLALHAVLLFLVRFAQPSLGSFASGAAPLHVTLEKLPADVAQPAGILPASQDSKGKEKIGVQEENSFPQRTLAAVQQAPMPADQYKTEIPKTFTSEEVMTVNKPEKHDVVESAPDLLVTKSIPPENPDSEEKPLAPVPSVEKPMVEFVPPAEKLVSTEPVSGEKQEKIVNAEPAQEKPVIEKSGSTVGEQEPVKVEEPKPVEMEVPKQVKVEQAKPVKVEEPVPVKVEELKAIKAEEPKPVRDEEPTPARETGTRENEVAEERKPQPFEGGKPEALHAEPPSLKMPSLAELGLASAKKFSNGAGNKIQFGERKKTIGLMEQDFRYAMYVEGLRLKLERIGQLNYPAAAARDKLSGTLSLIISVRSDGSLADISVARPSVYEVLNAGAEKIVRMSAPFAPFPENIRQDTDILNIRINWAFSRSGQSLD
jgi:protein TonB